LQKEGIEVTELLPAEKEKFLKVAYDEAGKKCWRKVLKQALN
jgi:hypothetical protein